MKRFAIYCTVLALLSAFPFTLSSQNLEQVGKNEIAISDAWVSREERTLIIDYSIDLGENIISCDVALMMSLDGGYTFSPVAVTDKVMGDVGRITTSGQKQITYDIDSIKESLAGKKLAFKVQVKNKKKVQDNKGRVFIMGTGSTLKMFGLKAGYVKKFGGYISLSDGFNSGNGSFINSMFATWKATAGGVMQVLPWLYPYAGVGYGKLQVNPDDALWNYYLDERFDEIYDTIGVDYVLNKYGIRQYYIMPIEIGAMFRLSSLTLSVGVEPLVVFGEGILCTFQLGLGVSF